MPSSIRILDINPGSDGDGRKWPKHHYVRNDDYFKERLATDKWIKELPGGPEPGVTYRLNKLPNGYAGFERPRPDTKHVDRYIYGHPNGQFRSLNEFFPHFKHLMDYGGPVGCGCVRCKGTQGKNRAIGSALAESGNDSEISEQSRYFARPRQQAQRDQEDGFPQDQLISPFTRPRGRLGKGSDSEQPKPQKRKLVDFENTPDIYEVIIEKLKAAGSEGDIDEPIEERMSPDWRTGNSLSKDLLRTWQSMPRYVPRSGEVVLFVRKLNEVETIIWDKSSQTFRRANLASKTWLDRPKWEAGVVTEMPIESVSEQDLQNDDNKEQNVTNSGFRVEPLSEPGSENKPYTKKSKYVPLHAMRPFYLWQECLNGVLEKDWDATIKHALTVMSSFSVVGRYRFKGVWPKVTVFSRGVYIGSELIMVGDTVRLLPRKSEQPGDAVTDVMVVTAVRLRFVNLDMESDDELLGSTGLPYQTCLHVSGRVYTQDPTRSFDGIGKVPIDSKDSTILSAGMGEFGQWYHYSDPRKTAARIELPYSRILGRHYEDTATMAWFSTPMEMPPPSLKAINTKPIIVKGDDTEISRGLEGMVEARNYGVQNDKRIKAQEGMIWFWGDTRIEQLDLHEVNGRFVGVKHALRNKEEMTKWRTALKALDGKKGGLEEYRAAMRAEKAERENAAPASSAYGMVAGSMQTGRESTTEAETGQAEGEDEDDEEGEHDEGDEEDDDNGEAVEVDDEPKSKGSSSTTNDEDTPLKSTPKKFETISLTDSEDEDELAKNQLVGDLVKNIRPFVGR